MIGVFAAMSILGVLATAQRAGFSAVKQIELSSAALRDEKKIIAKYGGIYKEQRLIDWLQRITDRLIAASGRPNLQFGVAVLNSPAINAFALPSGRLYVTRGLLLLANDTSELAAVLAHEIAHVTASHAAIRFDRARRLEGTDSGAREATDTRSDDAFAMAKSNLAVALFFRAQEIEADRIGLKVAAKAGFDPEGGVRFLMAMERAAKLSSGSGLDREPFHPLVSDRVINLQLNGRRYARQDLGREEKVEYLANVEGLIFGEDTRRGSIRGRQVLFAKLDLAVDVPEGFVINSANETGSLFAADEAGRRMLWIEVLKPMPARSLSAYLPAGIAGDSRLYSVEEVSINGNSAVTALGDDDRRWIYRIYAVHTNSAIYRFVFAAEHMTQENEGAFRLSVETLRRITAAETEASNPAFLKILTLEHGGASEQVWEKTAALHVSLERFLVLNNLEAGQLLAPGEMVKIIVKDIANRVSEIPTSDPLQSWVTAITTDQTLVQPRVSRNKNVTTEVNPQGSKDRKQKVHSDSEGRRGIRGQRERNHKRISVATTTTQHTGILLRTGASAGRWRGRRICTY
jgi:predicted Zn-dependent protease